MEAVVIACPPRSTPARLGERFRLRPGAPLRVGPGREARLRLGEPGCGDLLLEADEEGAWVRLAPPALRASLSGRVLAAEARVALSGGDCLFVAPGLVLELRERAPPPVVRHAALEAVLATSDDDGAWAAWRDQLEQEGDPLAAWLVSFSSGSLRQLRGLAESARAGLVEVSWSPRGLLSSVSLTREAVLGELGLRWHLEQLAGVPVARLLPRLSIALFAGAAPPGEDGDALAALALEHAERLDCAPALRELSLGFVSLPREWPRARAAWRALRQRAPLLPEAFTSALVTGARATLTSLTQAPGAQSLADVVVLNPQRSDLGTGPGCLVRVVGEAPGVCCTLSRSVEGAWVVFDEGADPFRAATGRYALRVNGTITARATLKPGDVIEPVEGLRFRFGF